MALRPEIQALIKARSAAGFPSPADVPIAEYRRWAQANPDVNGVTEEIYQVLDRFIVGPTSYLPIRIFRPHNTHKKSALVYFHGGGWAASTVDHYNQALSCLANELDCVVIAVTYQKAPEHPFPIPFDDCYATLEWVVKNHEALAIDPAKIGVGGDSAGGNLAAAVALKARDTHLCNLAYQLLIYPCTEPIKDSPSVERNNVGFGLTKEGMAWFEQAYIQGQEVTNTNLPYLWPALADNHKDVAPAIIMTAYYDVLQDMGSRYAEKLRSAGVRVVHKDYPEANHGCFIYGGISDYSRSIQLDLAAEVKQFL